jgi:hypothetical protein
MYSHRAITRSELIVDCKGCRRPVPTNLECLPLQPVAVRCPLCSDHRYYRPAEVYAGQLAYQLVPGGKRI